VTRQSQLSIQISGDSLLLPLRFEASLLLRHDYLVLMQREQRLLEALELNSEEFERLPFQLVVAAAAAAAHDLAFLNLHKHIVVHRARRCRFLQPREIDPRAWRMEALLRCIFPPEAATGPEFHRIWNMSRERVNQVLALR
jgi:hypothetical protein